MSFAIRYAGREFPLGEGRFTIGRSEDCQLCLDDPVASRRHAAIFLKDGLARVQDLNSRNGVFLNGARIEGELELKDGDVIRVGLQEMSFVLRAGRPGAETLIQRQTASHLDTFGVLGGLAEKAISLGRGDEAERIIGRQLASMVERAEAGTDVTDVDFQRAVSFCLRLAELTRKARWLSALFRLHAARGTLMNSETVNVLYSLGPKVEASSRPALRDYLGSLASEVEGYAPGDRFVLKRLEGLEQVLR